MKRQQRINLRVSDQEKDLIFQNAKKSRLTVSNYLRILSAMPEIIFDDTHERDPNFMVEHINALLHRVKELEDNLRKEKDLRNWFEAQAEKYQDKYVTLKALNKNDK